MSPKESLPPFSLILPLRIKRRPIPTSVSGTSDLILSRNFSADSARGDYGRQSAQMMGAGICCYFFLLCFFFFLFSGFRVGSVVGVLLSYKRVLLETSSVNRLNTLSTAISFCQNRVGNSFF